MRLLIVLLFVSISSFGQKLNQKSVKPDSTIQVKPNALQLQRLDELQKQSAQIQALIEDHIQLILGVKKEDIEKLEFKDGVFVYTLKKK